MSKKHYDGDSILHRLFSLLFWFTVCGGVCLLIGATLMLGFTTGPKPTHFNDFIGLLVLGTCAFPVLLLAVYRTFLYIIYGSKVAYKFKSHWQAAFVPTLLLSVLLIIGYLVTIFRDSEESRTSNNSSAISKPSITIRDAISQGDITVVQQH